MSRFPFRARRAGAASDITPGIITPDVAEPTVTQHAAASSAIEATTPLDAVGRERSVRRITLISKPGCHLCDEARAVIERVAAATGAEVEELNMLDDPALVARYAEQIPVTLVDGRQHDYWRVDEARLRKALDAPVRGR